ncbi:MAG TPA: DUF4388 domain-containing protein [Thermoanaerobaculia bacterium]|nr:DUF4388 domain-containing protein [Thermoanaerobaculia bacterium]
MAVEGTLDRFHLPEILQMISQQRKTGILTVQGADDIVAVSFLQGRIVAADALNESTEEGLGAVLVEQGELSADTLRQLTGRSEAEGVRLADLLEREGQVDREDLLDALRRQTQRLVLTLLDWRQGAFKFYGGDEVSYEEGFRSIGVDELLLRAIEEGRSAERQEIPSPESRMRRLEAARPVQVRAAASLDELPAAASDDGSAIWLTPEEESVLEAVSPARTVAEVARQAGVATDRARYVLYGFQREGLVAPAPTGTPPRPAGPARRPLEARPPRAEPLQGEAPAAESARPARVPPAARLAAAIALAGALLVGIALVTSPIASLLPFPWLEEERASVHATQDSARLLELDLAAKTYFLLHGRFPDELGELLELGLLAPGDLADSRGRRLVLEPRAGSYLLRPLAPGSPVVAAEEGFREGIAGNFLLDPEFLQGAHRRSGTEPPLVLLD